MPESKRINSKELSLSSSLLKIKHGLDNYRIYSGNPYNDWVELFELEKQIRDYELSAIPVVHTRSAEQEAEIQAQLQKKAKQEKVSTVIGMLRLIKAKKQFQEERPNWGTW